MIYDKEVKRIKREVVAELDPKFDKGSGSKERKENLEIELTREERMEILRT